MNQQELRARAKQFAIGIVRLCRALPKDWDIREIGKQLLRSGTSVAANYRACGRARSDKEFCSKLGVVVEEADESQLWLDLVAEAHPPIKDRMHKDLLSEAGELTAIFTASYKTARANLEQKKEQKRKSARRKPRARFPDSQILRFPDFQISRFPNFQITPLSAQSSPD